MLISSHRFRSFGRGFTLIELLMVVSIVTIITTVFLLQQRRFDSSTLLRSLAYSIALSVRQAQVYGTSVRQFGTTQSGFSYSYGLYFNSQTFYILFADSNPNNRYDSSPDEKVQTFNISSGYNISQFCAVRTTGEEDCFAGGGKNGGTGITYLTIYFKRPNPDAQFYTGLPYTYTSAYIKITGPQDVLTRVITVTVPGQISVTTGALGL